MGTKMSLDVESILHSIGVEVLREYGDELLGKCPMHVARTGKEDRNPSWSVNTKTYVHHCFSCGYSGSLTSLYRDLVGDVPENLEWELSKQSLLASVDKPVRVESTGPAVNEWVLNNYVDLPDKLMTSRKLTREAVDHFGIKWDTNNKVWVIPVRTPGGDLMGFQFRQKGIVLNHPPGMSKSTTLFGMNLFSQESRITIVESPLDAVRLYGVGIPAVSSFGAAVSADQLNLLSRNFRYVVSAMDNDPPGMQANEIIKKVLTRRGCVFFKFDYTGLTAKDPGDVESDTELVDAWRRSISLNMTGAL
jgi:DNA primase